MNKDSVKKYLPGMRIYKSALAVVVCFLSVDIANKFLNFDFVSMYAAIAALFTLHNTHEISKRRGLNRIYGTLIGTIITILILFIGHYLGFNSNNVIIIFIGITLIIHICNLLGFNEGILAACIVFIASYTYDSGEFYTYVIIRAVETVYGVIVAILINKYIFPYKEKNKSFD